MISGQPALADPNLIKPARQLKKKSHYSLAYPEGRQITYSFPTTVCWGEGGGQSILTPEPFRHLQPEIYTCIKKDIFTVYVWICKGVRETPNWEGKIRHKSPDVSKCCSSSNRHSFLFGSIAGPARGSNSPVREDYRTNIWRLGDVLTTHPPYSFAYRGEIPCHVAPQGPP